MGKHHRRRPGKVTRWKQLPTYAIAGCALAGVSAPPVPPFSPCVTPLRTGPDRGAPGSWTGPTYGSAGFTAPQPFLFQRDFILGTSFDLAVWATQAREAHQVESIVLDEIDRLGRILSTYDPKSEISRLNAHGSLEVGSPDLIALLRAYETWTERTGGAVSGQLGGLLQIWRAAETLDLLPTDDELAACVGSLHSPGWRIDSQAPQVRRLGPQPLNVNCLGKGYILQSAMAAARANSHGVSGILLNIGGDISVWGDGGAQPGALWRIFCADPNRPQDNAPPLSCLELTNRAVATSAAYERGYTIEGKRYSHILDPRTGWPARGVASATVIALDGVTANALATALCILPPGEGLDLLHTIEGAEGLILAADGTQFRTPGFAAVQLPLAQTSPSPAASDSAPPTQADAAAPTNAAPPATPSPTSPTPVACTIIASAPLEAYSSDGRLTGVTQAVVGQSFQCLRVEGGQAVLQDDKGNTFKIRAEAVSQVPQPPPAPASVPTPPPAATAPTPSASTDSSWPTKYQVTLNVNLAPPQGARKVERPYVAIWIEDANAKPIRTVAVWGSQKKYLRELSNWWKFAQDESDVISATTRATRPAGQYEVSWDGLDDSGKPVPQGTYSVVLEVNREHGGHDIQHGVITCGTSPAQGAIPAALEFLDCPISYGAAE